MMSLLFFAQIAFVIQLAHSFEELSTGFHKKWYVFKMPFWVFLIFEITFSLFWGVAIFTNTLANNPFLLSIFLLLMFANGVQHLVWFGVTRKYNPGLVTSFVHLSWSTYSLLFLLD